MILADAFPGCCVHGPLYTGYSCFSGWGLDLLALKCSWLWLAVSAGKEVSAQQKYQLGVTACWLVAVAFTVSVVLKENLLIEVGATSTAASAALGDLPHPHSLLLYSPFSMRSSQLPGGSCGEEVSSARWHGPVPHCRGLSPRSVIWQKACRWEQCSTAHSLSPWPRPLHDWAVTNGLLEARGGYCRGDVTCKAALQLGLIIYTYTPLL